MDKIFDKVQFISFDVKRLKTEELLKIIFVL